MNKSGCNLLSRFPIGTGFERQLRAAQAFLNTGCASICHNRKQNLRSPEEPAFPLEKTESYLYVATDTFIGSLD